jgi:hypothetical protein
MDKRRGAKVVFDSLAPAQIWLRRERRMDDVRGRNRRITADRVQ